MSEGPSWSEDAEGGRSVYEELRSQILDGALSPGTPVVEVSLARSLGVSRTPIREALSQLAYEGLLERHERALRVRVLKPEDVLDLYEVRIALEDAAARAAADRRTELDLGRLKHTLTDMQALAPDDTDARPRLAHAFHFAIWRAAHNDVLFETLESVHLRVMGLSSTTLHYPERWKVFSDECATLLAAIRDRDAATAGETARQQMTNARDFRVELYSADPAQLQRHPTRH